jgi:L-fuculose-phosphate aldolase
MDFRQLVVDSGRRMLGEGLTVETWGNLSARDLESGLVYITPSGMDYREIGLEDVVVCEPDGRVASGDRRPSIETGLHLEVYRRRGEAGAIVHTHPVCSTAFSCIGEDIPLFMDEAVQALGDTVRTARYALPGSSELAAACAEALGSESNACLLKSHGAVCLGKGMDEAFRVAKVLEMTAEVYFRIRAMGKSPDPIPEDLYKLQQRYFRSP